MKPKLVRPSRKYLPSYLCACREYKEHDVRTHSMDDPDRFDEWRRTIFKKYRRHRRGKNLAAGYVPSTTFWLVEGREFIGAGNIRHYLTENLEKYGGHIGYLIRWSRWNQGYGTLQLSLLLREAAKLGIRQALITCDVDNIASARVMEKNGGVYQDTVTSEVEGELRTVKRYWCPTPYRK